MGMDHNHADSAADGYVEGSPPSPDSAHSSHPNAPNSNALGPVSRAEIGPAYHGDDLLFDSFGPETHGPGEPAGGFSPLHLFRYKWLMLSVFAFVAGVAIPAIWMFVTPKYEAMASLRVRPTISPIIFEVPEKKGMVPYYWQFLNTQVSIVRGSAVLDAVLNREDVKETNWYKKSPRTIQTLLGGEAPGHMERLKDAVDAGPRRNTELIDVLVTTNDGHDTKVIVDAIVDEYVKYTDEHTEEGEQLVYDTLREEDVTLQKEIAKLVEEIGEYSKLIGTSDPDIARAQLAKRVTELETDREKLARKYTLLAEELAALESSKAAAQTHETKTDITVHHYSNDEEWKRLNLQLKNKRHELTMAGQRFGASHPKIRTLDAEVGHLEGLLLSRQKELDTGVATVEGPKGKEADDAPMTLAELQRMVPKKQRELELLDEQLTQVRAEQLEKGEYAKTVATLQQTLNEKNDLHGLVRKRLQGLEFEDKAPGRISVASYGIEPKQPNKDRRPLMCAMAFFGAMMCGVGAAYLRVVTDSKIRGVGDVGETNRVPFLGQLPPLPRRCNLYGELPAVLTQHVRMVRTALLERIGKSGQRCVLITSSTMQTGKSVLSVLLAKSLAKLGKKVLLVEADMYRPSLSQHLNMKPLFGLPTLLQGAVTDSEAILPTGLNGFDILLVGEPPQDFNHDILANGVFSKCIERWKKKYDIVLMDGPPVLPVADARILANQADGTLMVLRSSHSRRADVVQTYADLSAAGGKLLGTVLVDAPTGMSYSSYSSYESEPKGRRNQYRLENSR